MDKLHFIKHMVNLQGRWPQVNRYLFLLIFLTSSLFAFSMPANADSTQDVASSLATSSSTTTAPSAAVPLLQLRSTTMSQFSKNLQLYDAGPDVLQLQQFLNSQGFMIAQTGPGSPSHETTFFGLKTYSALKLYQKAHQLPTTGFFGPLTRATTIGVSAATNSSNGTSASAPSPSQSTSSNAQLSPSLVPPWQPIVSLTLGGGGEGGGGGSSNNNSITPTPDTTPPSVSLTVPSANSTVGGSSVTLTATASDNVAIANVQFKVDGANIGSAITSSPYTTSWNSTVVTDGSHTLYAVAKDTSGNYATSSISVTVRNTPPVISAISPGSATSTSATITWTTDEAASSQVNYGTTSGYGTASSSATLATSHSIILSGLIAGTTYHFQVQSVDAEGNVATSSDQTFITPLSFLRVATTLNGALNAGGLSVSGTKDTFAFRVPIEIAQDSAQLVLSFNNWGTTNAGDVNNGNAITIIDAALDTGTSATPVLFGGSAGIVIADGANDVHSDPISPSGLGKTKFSRGEIYYIKGKISAPASTGHIPYALENPNGYTGLQSYRYNPASTTMSSTYSAGIYSSTGTAPDIMTANYIPIVLGYPYADQLSIIAVGDSVIAGFGDGATGLLNGTGYFQRGITDADGVSNPRPALNFSLPGNTTLAWTGANTKWTQFIQYANTGLNELGTNDITGSTATTTATADQLLIAQLFRAGGVSGILRPELLPNTTSTDNFQTSANQTPQAGWGPGQVAPQLNAWFTAKLADQTFQGVISGSAVRDAITPTNWLTNGTANYITTDGKHPNTNGAPIQAATLRSFLTTYVNPTYSTSTTTINPLDVSAGETLTNGNLTATWSGADGTVTTVRATNGVSTGKYYWEATTSGTAQAIGVASIGANLSTGLNQVFGLGWSSGGAVYNNGQVGTVASWSTGQTLSIALDATDRTIAFRVNGGNWNNNVANNPSVGAISLTNFTVPQLSNLLTLYPAYQTYHTNDSVTFNFAGPFTYSVPAGYSHL